MRGEGISMACVRRDEVGWPASALPLRPSPRFKEP